MFLALVGVRAFDDILTICKSTKSIIIKPFICVCIYKLLFTGLFGCFTIFKQLILQSLCLLLVGTSNVRFSSSSRFLFCVRSLSLWILPVMSDLGTFSIQILHCLWDCLLCHIQFHHGQGNSSGW